VRLAWDALRDSPYGLSTGTRAYDGQPRLSPPLPLLSVRLHYWFLAVLTIAAQASHLVIVAGPEMATAAARLARPVPRLRLRPPRHAGAVPGMRPSSGIARSTSSR
jgi:hypothetical protein